MQGNLVRTVDAFCAAPLHDLDQVGLQGRAVQARELARRLLGHSSQALAELDARYQGRVITNVDSEGPALYQATQGWWRDAATLTGSQAGSELRRAAVLRELPLIEAAVTDGTLSLEQAGVLCRLHDRIPLDRLQDSQPHLITLARGRNTEALALLVTHFIATHCEPALEADQAAAHERRYLQLRNDHDGTVTGRFVLTSEDAEALKTVLEPLARRAGEEDKRSAGQRRADALVEVFSGAATWMDLPHAGGQRAQLSYVITADWAAGNPAPDLATQLAAAAHAAGAAHAAEAASRAACTSACTNTADLATNPAGTATSAGLHPLALARYAATGAWTGPQTRTRIETVVCDARISRLLLDPHGTVLSLEALTDAITPAQRRAVSARDRQCIARGCTRPPAFCDVHHLTHREHGGSTTIENLVLLCRRHHVLWHRGTLALHDLHTPWLQHLPDTANDTTTDAWDGHDPPLIG